MRDEFKMEEIPYGIDDLIEVELRDDEAFLQVAETLTRIGIANFKTHTLTQTCHILQKRGRYFIVHFKELFALDGKCTREHFSEEDHLRRNQIVGLLETWGLVKMMEPEMIDKEAHRVKVFVLKFAESQELDIHNNLVWTLETKYDIGENK